MLHWYFKRCAAFLKKKMDFSFLNAAGVLLVTGVLLTTFHIGLFIKSEITDSDKFLLTQNGYQNLTYIKPFTSLVGFNWKFNKENKRKNKEEKATTFILPALILLK